MELKDYFTEGDLEKVEKIIIQFHDRTFFDKKINNPSALLLSTYMLSNKNSKGMIKKEEVKDLFIKMGRTGTEFDKALYELSGKRKGKNSFIDIEKDFVGLNLEGLNKIKGIFKFKNG